jgi:Holliday junction resolvasome RuvABC endonuclease subunit
MSVRILGIDPATGQLGAGALELDCYERKPFKLIYADTLNGEHNEFGVRADNPAQTRAKGLTRAYGHIFDMIDPAVVGCEDNFLGPNPASFKRLIEVVSYLNIYTVTNKADTPFKLVLPRLAKKIVGADFTGSTKDDVREGLKKCPFLDLNGFDLDTLTWDANDGILIALYVAVQYYKDLGWDVFDDSHLKG